MKNFNLVFWLVSLLLIGIWSCEKSTKKQKEDQNIMSIKQAKVAGPSANCGAFCDPPVVDYHLPTDVCNLSQQTTLNCFAWTNFLALNWNSSNTRGIPDSTRTASSYGVPGDFSPTVWESYLNIDDVFTDHGPLPWINNNLKRNSFVKKMTLLNKVGHIQERVNKKILKAAGGSVEELFQAKGAWLTDQKGNLVWYEVKINLDEYNFIANNKLYDPINQVSYAAANNGLWLPGGPSVYGNQGAMELKAAWKVVSAKDLDSVKPYYKISKAMVPEVLGFDKNKNLILGEYSMQYLALVGLHIIRKTDLAHQFVWMTFEHVDNAPTEGEVDPKKTYSFFNKASTAVPNQSPDVVIGNLKNPVQVTRIASNALNQDIKALNAYVQNLIRQSNPNSVWQYYQLVNVQWPQSAVTDQANHQGKIPLDEGGITPTNIANVTLETYAQEDYCMSCHKFASVNNSKFATGYSFIFSNAKTQINKASAKNTMDMKQIKTYLKQKN
ncbi:hypothetical protein [Flavobacterium sp. MDT1-60]|uniref:hypothetical protein n=1 Tax=Flavobacterium sp. MDT1-60 TaxID=1979344 RepID=UPI001785D708|nr:hypothetical protein [Flavobacterium sp. MDT1-60]QOG01169.1 hypothetical protein IHE43_15260 [Flavobacterium sp. MDT1-60]